MAHFRGTIKGGRGEASRLGHSSTGLVTEAAGWNSGVRVELYVHECGADHCRIFFTDGSKDSGGILVYDGPCNRAAANHLRDVRSGEQRNAA